MADYVRIMPCLDMKDGRVVKGVKFVDLRDAGDPVECAVAYCEQGADEIAFLDITATVEKRRTMLDVFRKVAKASTVPLTLGGGIRSLRDVEDALKAGAEKVSMASAAVRRPELIEEAASEFGTEHVVVAIDADKSEDVPGGYEVYVDGGRTPTRIGALEFAREAESRGAGTILPTSKACDGAKSGYDIPLIRGIADRVRVPVVASGGAGCPDHLADAILLGGAEAALAASIFHYGQYSIQETKRVMRQRGVPVRL